MDLIAANSQVWATPIAWNVETASVIQNTRMNVFAQRTAVRFQETDTSVVMAKQLMDKTLISLRSSEKPRFNAVRGNNSLNQTRHDL